MSAASGTAQIQTLVDALVATGWRLWTTSHNNTPSAQIVHRWMRSIALGHFVLEITKTNADRMLDRIGVLLAITSSHEYTIRTIDGRKRRWNNVEFVRIPQSAADNREIFLLEESATSTEPCGHKYTAGFCRFCGNPDPRST